MNLRLYVSIFNNWNNQMTVISFFRVVWEFHSTHFFSNYLVYLLFHSIATFTFPSIYMNKKEKIISTSIVIFFFAIQLQPTTILHFYVRNWNNHHAILLAHLFVGLEYRFHYIHTHIIIWRQKSNKQTLQGKPINK